MLVHKGHEALLYLDKLLFDQFFLSFNFSQLLFHATENLSVSLQVTDGFVSLKLVLFGLIRQPAHVLLKLLVFSMETLTVMH